MKNADKSIYVSNTICSIFTPCANFIRTPILSNVYSVSSTMPIVDTTIYGVFTPLNKEIYRSIETATVKDYISVETTGAVGVMGQAGVRLNEVTPYAILGIQYGPLSLTYTAEDNGTKTTKTYKNKQPVFIFGLGMMGHASDNVTIGLELYRKVSYDFTVIAKPA